MTRSVQVIGFGSCRLKFHFPKLDYRINRWKNFGGTHSQISGIILSRSFFSSLRLYNRSLKSLELELRGFMKSMASVDLPSTPLSEGSQKRIFRNRIWFEYASMENEMNQIQMKVYNINQLMFGLRTKTLRFFRLVSLERVKP